MADEDAFDFHEGKDDVHDVTESFLGRVNRRGKLTDSGFHLSGENLVSSSGNSRQCGDKDFM